MATLEQLTPEEAVSNLRNAGFIKEAESAGKALGVSKQPTPITTTTIQEQPRFNIQTVPQGTEAVGTLGAIQQMTDTERKRQQYEQTQKETTQQSQQGIQSILGSILGQETPSELRLQFGKEEGIQPKEAEKNRLLGQLEQEQRALELKTRAIQGEAGLTAGQKDVQVSEMTRKSLQKQADQAILYNIANRDYESARDYVEKKVTAQFERQALELDAKKFQYQENKELFNKNEQRAYEAFLKAEDRDIEKAKTEMATKENIAFEILKNGGSSTLAAKVRSAGTVEEAMSLGGQYVGLMDRQLQYAQLNKIQLENLAAQASMMDMESGFLDDKDIRNIDLSPQGKKLPMLADLKSKLNNYQSLVEQSGMELFGKDKAKLDNAYKELQLAYKEAANLGVLAGPDMEIIESAIRSATGWGALGNIGVLGGKTRTLKANLEEAQKTLNTNATNNLDQLHARNPKYRDSLYVQSLVLPFGDELLTNAELQEMEAALNE